MKATRNNKWKLFLKKKSLSGGYEPVKLYDLETDPLEKHDKLTQHTEISNQLLKEAQQFYLE